MKLTDIEQLLALPYRAEIQLKEVPLEFIHEASRIYDTDFYTGEHTTNKWTTIKRNNIELTLNTSKH